MKKPWPGMIVFAGSITVLMCLLCSVAFADTIVLTNGGRLHGKIESENDREVVINVANMGTITVNRSRIKEIHRDNRGISKPKKEQPEKQPPPRKETPPPPSPKKTPPRRYDATSIPAAPNGPAAPILDAYRKTIKKEKDSVPLDVIRQYLKKLEPLGRKATRDLAHTLSYSKDWRERYLAVRALGPLKDPDAAGSLIRALGDKFYGGIDSGLPGILHQTKYTIRERAIEALKAIGQKAYKALLDTAADADNKDQLHALYGLTRIEVPGKVSVLIRIARDTTRDKKARQLAVKGLTKQKEGAQQALVELLPDKVVQKEVEKALKFSKDKTAIEPLMNYIRKAQSDYDLARRAAISIGWIDHDWTPKDTNDCVDFLLHFYKLENIKKKLGNGALRRLNFWANSNCADMKKRAQKALTHYK